MKSTFQQIRYPVILLLCFTLVFQPELAAQANGKSYILGNDVLAQATDSPTPEYLLYDGHGSVRQLTNSSGSVIESYSYDAYGVMLGGNPTPDAPAATSLLYAGEMLDSDLQQYYLRARWYSPSVGRFNRLDPYSGNNLDPQSLHKYLYAHCNPINNIDPSGMQGLLVEQLTVWRAIGMIIANLAPHLLMGVAILGTSAAISLVLEEVLPPILDAIAEGVEGAEKIYSAAVASVVAMSAAKSKALRKAAKALGETIEKLKKLKPFFVFEAATPNIYKFTKSCLIWNPMWYCLTWHANPARRATNRAWIMSTYGHLRRPGYSIDEFPYASTEEGGPNIAMGCAVPKREHCAQGGYLKGFYYGILRKPSKFLVVPVPR